LDINAFADQITDALLDSSMKSLQQVDPPKEETEPSSLEDEAKEAQSAEEQQSSEAPAEERSSDGPPPLPAGSQAERSQEQAQDELRQSVESEAKEPEAPGVAVMNAIQGWFDGLAKSNQEKLTQAGRYDKLKNSIQTTMDGVADTVSDAIRSSIADWRSEHEETLIKSRRFAKKNFDTLEELIPKLAASMVKKVNESRTHGLTHEYIRARTFDFLNKRFDVDPSGTLKESKTYSVTEMQTYRLNKLAGLD